MSKIVIGFSRPKSRWALIAHLIRLFEGRTPYSHVFISWHSDSIERTMIYEAKGNGVNFTGEQNFKAHNLIVYEYDVEINEKQKKRILQFCVDNSRTHYGYLQLIGIGLVRFVGMLGLKIVNPFTSGNICSEIAAKVLLIVEPSINIPFDIVGPKDVFKIVTKISKKNQNEN